MSGRSEQSSVELVCGVCGSAYSRTAKKAARSKYCSRPCAQIGVSRASAALRGDVLRGRGLGKTKYVKRCGRHEHRIVAEQILGRPLEPGEIVHHIDRDGRNNDPSNLMIFGSRAEHMAEHRDELNAARAAVWDDEDDDEPPF
jgi:hypothetical protein